MLVVLDVHPPAWSSSGSLGNGACHFRARLNETLSRDTAAFCHDSNDSGMLDGMLRAEEEN